MHFTPTQQRLLDVFSDGKGHTTSELVKCLNDELQEPKSVRVMVFLLNKKLIKKGEKIVSIRTGKPGKESAQYLHVRLLRNDE